MSSDTGKNELAQDRTEWAQERTEWAEDRTVMANERTFAGWMRTGLSSIAIGLGFKAIFRSFEPTWIAKFGSSIFILIAIFIFYNAYQSASKVLSRMEAHDGEPQSAKNIGLLALSFSLGSIFVGIILWLL